MNDPTIYLHIGLPKTGTTFLQRKIFPALPSLRYFNKPKSALLQGKIDPIYGIMDRFFSRSALIWEHQGDHLFSEVLGLTKGTPPEKSILISDEGIGAQNSYPVLLSQHLERFGQIACDWGFSRVCVLCVIRRQDRWLASHYAQLSDRKANASQKSFESYVRDWLSPSVGRFHDGMRTDYKALYSQLVTAVRPSNVLMLPYEWFEEDAEGFLERLFAFFELSSPRRLKERLAPEAFRKHHNRRSTSENSWQLRTRHVMDTKVVHLQPAGVLKILGLPTALPVPWPETQRESSIELSPTLSREILGVYARGNRQLASTLGIDLGRYGYFGAWHDLR